MKMNAQHRALVLLSSGLDSQLAACLLRDQGIELHALVFSSPIIDTEPAVAVAESMNLPISMVDFTKPLVDVVERCQALDDAAATLSVECHAEMLRCAVERLEEYDCDFVCTGEVLNQGTPTQMPDALGYAAAYTGKADLILRPLSAQCLEPTAPEREGWVNRGGLEGIDGPDTTRQRDLTTRFGLEVLGEPSGLSRLTDPVFTDRLADLRVHEGLHGRRALELLRLGRHFRLGPVTKLVLGSTAEENAELVGSAELYDLVLQIEDVPGPVGLLPIIATEDQVRLAAAICVHFSEVEPDGTAPVKVRSTRSIRQIEVRPAAADQVARVKI